MYGLPIPVVEKAKFWGLLFDKKLIFIPYIKALKANCLKALDDLKVLSNTKSGGDRSSFLNLYRSLVRSKLAYGLSRYKKKPQKLTQLSQRSHPRHLMGKMTAQKDVIIDTTSDRHVGSNFPYRWSPASLTFNNYHYLFYIYI